ncbi:hypothetical protein [Komagataeibacter europaeus]|uniref:Uncharacterized protein n=1 Tax=Komagataeibacter europaeus NBRC 3261 TaxID=1234669 RepID=A0A0D6PX68_KOMEU|nr:hypothetical protein [Komagataeibacter europaeus]ARW16677.1 hypothetical protein S101446_01551 [Komagataeibacter europaeus]GAN95759.1 hypothetical protein Geu3261_0037_005 [Komagataeibacter europaeus NBRC 3261]
MIGLPGVFVVFALITVLLQYFAPRFHGIWDTLLAFYALFALVAAFIELRVHPKPAPAVPDKSA